MPRPTIVVDDREKRPYRFKGRPTVSKRLRHGDYSLLGFESRVAIERKSVPDLIGSFTTTRKRMLSRIQALGRLELAALVVEGSPSSVAAGSSRSAVNGGRLLGTVLLECSAAGVAVIFCGDMTGGEAAVARLLDSYHARAGAEREGGPDPAFEARKKLVERA